MMYKMAMGIAKKYKKNPKRNESMTSMLSRKSDKTVSPAHIPEKNVNQSILKSIYEDPVNINQNLPPLPYKPIMKQKSNKVFLTVGKTDKTSQDLLAVKRNSIARQGSQLPNRNKQMFDYSRMETKNVSFHESVKRDRDVVHMSSLAKSGENDNDEENKIQVNNLENQENEAPNDTVIKTSTDEEEKSEKEESNNVSSESKSSLQLKTGLVDSPFITPTQNVLLKCCKRSKIQSIRRNMKKHLKALEFLGNIKKR